MAKELRAKLDRGQVVDLRGDGKAGGGLVLVVQAFSAALAESGLDVQDWPLFSSARKGANVRAYLRTARAAVESTCQVRHPDIAVLMNEAAGEEIDFAEGTEDALYVVNTSRSPEDTGRRYRLSGRVATVAGDGIGSAHLGRPLGNVPVFAALVKASGLVEPGVARASLERAFAKRRLPEKLVAANLRAFDVALEQVHVADVSGGSQDDHRAGRFRGYDPLPIGAQAALRSSRRNRTSGYGRPGVKVEFADPNTRCNGCSLCVVQCPEGIISFRPDPSRGAIVHGAEFDTYCKVCRECIAACPLDLFHEVSAVQPLAEEAP